MIGDRYVRIPLPTFVRRIALHDRLSEKIVAECDATLLVAQRVAEAITQ